MPISYFPIIDSKMLQLASGCNNLATMEDCFPIFQNTFQPYGTAFREKILDIYGIGLSGYRDKPPL